MSNDANGNPWVLDTAAVIRTTPVKIQSMVWEPNAADNDLTILDNKDKSIWDQDATTGGDIGERTIKFADGVWFHGFNLSVIDGGTLRVYIK